VTTSYEYDPKTFRLINLRTTRKETSPDDEPWGSLLQDLNYHYDPVGNIIDLRDDAQNIVFFDNQKIEPHSAYTYDALYRLLTATGREHIGQTSNKPPEESQFFKKFPHPEDMDAMRYYRQEFEYDELGNITQVKHRAGSTNSNYQDAWTRRYKYDDISKLNTAGTTNRLTATSLDGTTWEAYTHDAHGNMTAMPHLSAMHWDYADQLKAVDLPNGGMEYYAYAAPNEKGYGERSRKVTHQQGGKICDRIYLGGFEVYRERNVAGTLELERQTLHIMDDKSRIALVDTLTKGTADGETLDTPVIRYQLSNHLGSATLEVDHNAALISYEEYYPFGASSYRAGRSVEEVKAKRYRYAGKERDESTGLDYYGARYYVSWFCRFVSVDGLKDEYPFYSSYQYAGNKPISFIDIDGLEPTSPPSSNNVSLITYPHNETNQLHEWEWSGKEYIDKGPSYKLAEVEIEAKRVLTKGEKWGIGISIILGIGLGLLAVATGGLGLVLAAGAAASIAGHLTESLVDNKKISLKGVAVAGLEGATTELIFKGTGRALKSLGKIAKSTSMFKNFQNAKKVKEIERLEEQGIYTAKQIENLSSPYTGIGHHYIPRELKNEGATFIGRKINQIIESDLFRMKGKDFFFDEPLSKAQFYAKHLKAHSSSRRFGHKGWSPSKIGLQSSDFWIQRVWYGLPKQLSMNTIGFGIKSPLLDYEGDGTFRIGLNKYSGGLDLE
jgi:RHS repeat-associated protein